MTIKPVSKGGRVQEALSADTWNAFVRAANANDLSSNIGEGRPATGQEDPYSTVKVHCSTAQIAQREVLGLSDPSILPSAGQRTFDNRMLFAQTAPLQGRFGLAELAGAQNVYNRVISDGVVQCTVQVPANGEWIKRADIDSGDVTRLLATPNGSAQILWKETGTGEVPAIVRLGNPEFVALPGKANGPIVAGTSSGSVIIWQNGTTTNYPINSVHLDWMAGGLDISNDKEVLIAWFPDEQLWRVIGAECEDTKERAVGQLQDDASVLTPQSLTTTPVAWNNFSASEELGTSNVTLNSAAATIQLPDVTDPLGDVYNYSYTGILTPGSNNNTYVIDATVNGVPVNRPLLVDGRQSGTSLSFSFTGKFLVAQQSAPVVGLTIAMDTGTDTINWNGGLFLLDRDTDF